MERSNPEFPKSNSKEFSAESKEKLTFVKNLLTSLLESLNKGGRINSIYSEIAKEQTHAHPNQLIIKEKKLALITACIEYKTPLLHAASTLPPEIKKYFNSNDADLITLSEKLIEDVGNLYDQDLTKNPEENAFRVSVWLDKISVTLAVINTILEKENA
jgi:hypothetical protein